MLGLPLEPESRVVVQTARRARSMGHRHAQSKIPEWSPEDLAVNLSETSDNQKNAGVADGGYLFRRSQSDPLVWYRRWCVVRGDCMWCCKSRLSQRHIIKIPLAHTEVGPSSLAGKNRAMRQCFEINAARRVYMFRAKSV